MTTVGEVSVKISADLAPLRKAQAEALKIMADLDRAITQSAKNIASAMNQIEAARGKSFIPNGATKKAYDFEGELSKALTRSIKEDRKEEEQAARQAASEAKRQATEAAKFERDLSRALTASIKADRAEQAAALKNTTSLTPVGNSNPAEQIKKIGDEAKGAIQPVRQYNQFIKDSGQFSQQAAFQFNDLFVQLASGQSAFTAITQQGAQLSQMFAPGTGIGAAAKSTGAAFAQFLVNPLNLAIVGIAAVAGAIPLIWSAVTGDDSAAAKASLIEFDQLVKNIGLSSESSAKSLEKLTQRPFSQPDLSYQATLSREQQQAALRKSLEATAKRAQDTSNAMAVLEASNAAYGVGVTETAQKQNELVQKMADLSKEAAKGDLTVQQLRDRLREIALDPQASAETRKLANELFVGTQEAFKLEGQLKATANAAIQLGTAFRNATAIKGGRNGDQTVATDLAARIDSEGIEKLKNDLIAQKNELENVAGELGVFEIPTPERRPTRELGYNGDEFGTSKKPKKAGSGERDKDFIANLQSETMFLQQQLDIMGKTYDERVRLTDQYKLEKDIRDALTRLGEKATPAQKAAVEEQIRLQQQLNAELQKQEAINQVVSDAQIEAAGLIGSAINGAITGSKDLKAAMLDVAIAIAKAALQAQLLQSFSNGKGGMSIGGSIISAFFGGLAGARAKGGPVAQGSSYLVGEEGPEIFTANRSGVIIPNNKLGSGSIGGNSNSSSTTSDVRVWVDDDGNWQAAVERIATKTSANTTRQGIAEYDKSIPNRIQQINQNPSRR